MAAALVVLVALDTFLSGWLLAKWLELRKVVTMVSEMQQQLAHDMDVIDARLGGRDA